MFLAIFARIIKMKWARGGYLSRKVTGVCGPEEKKPTHSPIFFPGLTPISTDFFPVSDPYLQIFGEDYQDFSQLFDD